MKIAFVCGWFVAASNVPFADNAFYSLGIDSYGMEQLALMLGM
jgi:hypothetical protein